MNEHIIDGEASCDYGRGDTDDKPGNARLIAAAVNALPGLIEAVELLRELTEQLTRIHADSKHEAVWTLWQSHFGPYEGPQYALQYTKARAWLAKHASLRPQPATPPHVGGADEEEE